MDGLSIAASVVAVIQISSQVFDLCRTYYINVKDARKDIERLREEIMSLQDVLVNALDLASSQNSSSLKSLKVICQEGGLVQQCKLDLTALAAKIDLARKDNTMMQFGIRALKWPLTKREVDKTLLSMERHKVSFSLALGTDQTALSLAIKQDLSEMKQEFEAQMLDDERGAIIHWLSTTDPAINHQAACIKCQPETGKWLIDQVDFQEWKVMPNSLLWLYGIPGCGKTILCSTIIQHLQYYGNENPTHAIAYFYFDFNNTLKQEALHCLSSIIAQLSRQIRILPAHVKDLYKRSSYGKQQANISELKETLFKIIENLNHVFIVIDALDECRKIEEREQLLAVISDLNFRSLANVHVLTTSRRELDIEEALLPLITTPAIPVCGSQVDLDIKLHISRQLAEDQLLKRWPKAVKAEIEETLVAGANGMFRWVVCQLDALKRCLKVSLIRRELKTLPKTLDETYTRLFLDIDQLYLQDAKRALLWLAFSERRLQLKELAEATIISPQSDPPFDPEERFPDPQSISKILSSLVTVSSDQGQDATSHFNPLDTVTVTETITLAHFSVKEYLISDRIQNCPAHHFAASDSTAHFFIADCCLKYILYYASSASKSESRADLQAFPLLEYAATYWYKHMNLTTYEQQKLLTPLALMLMLSESSLSSWLLVHRPESPTRKAFDDVSEINTALFYGSAMGLLPVVQELLNSGWDPNTGSLNDGTARHRAILRGIVLVESRTEFDSKEILGLAGSTPLFCSVEAGHTAVVRSLLEHGAKVNVQSHEGWSPLHVAAYYGFDDITHLLIDYGAIVNETMKNTKQTAFHWAAFRENSLVVDSLLSMGADINAKNLYGETALHYAAARGHKMLQQLLDKGADTEVDDDHGETPLYWAASSHLGRTRKAVEILMNAGAKPDAPLLISATNGVHEALHELLLIPSTNAESASTRKIVLHLVLKRGFELCSECWENLSQYKCTCSLCNLKFVGG